MANPNDEFRRQILQYFYDRNDTATSRFGKKGSAAKISDVKRELKAHYGLTQQQAMSNLTYLIDRGWVNVVEVEKTVQVRGGSVPSTVAWYEISAQGIDKIEGASEFEAPDRYPGINITATGTNVITAGDGNVVNARFADLHAQLDVLKDAISQSEALDDTEKLDIAVDIETLKDQLAKAVPDKTIVGHLWSSIEKAVTAAGFVTYTGKIAPLVGALVS